MQKVLSKTYLGMFAAKVGIRLTKDVLIIMKREWLIQFSYFFFLHCLLFDTLHQTAGLFILTYPYTFLAASHFWRGCCNPQKIRVVGVVI